MKYFKIAFLIIFLFGISNNSFASDVYFIDLKKILNQSKAVKQAQQFLLKKFETESKKFEKEGQALKKEETDLISKKKLVSKEEYKESLTALREKNINYQKKRRKASNDMLVKKNEARAKLIKALNPILKKYMEDNNIQIILDKKNVLVSNSKFELTDEILKILDKELKSIKLN